MTKYPRKSGHLFAQVDQFYRWLGTKWVNGKERTMYPDFFYFCLKKALLSGCSATTTLTDLAADFLAPLSPAQQNPRPEAEIFQ